MSLGTERKKTSVAKAYEIKKCRGQGDREGPEYQWFSNLVCTRITWRRACQTQSGWSHPKRSDSVALGWGPKFAFLTSSR